MSKIPIKYSLFLFNTEQERILKLAELFKRYKGKKYSKSEIDYRKLLDIHNKRRKTFDSWYAKDNELTIEGYLCLLCKLLNLPLYAVLVLLDAYIEYDKARNALNDNDRLFMRMFQIENINGKPYFTLGKNLFGFAVVYAYSYKRYYYAIQMLVEKGYLIQSDEKRRGKKLYTLSTKALCCTELYSAVLKKINNAIKNSTHFY